MWELAPQALRNLLVNAVDSWGNGCLNELIRVFRCECWQPGRFALLLTATAAWQWFCGLGVHSASWGTRSAGSVRGPRMAKLT